MLSEYDGEIQRLRIENSQLRYQKELKERDLQNVMFENQTLYSKLENLENVFIGQPLQRDSQRSQPDGLMSVYQESNLAAENIELRRKLAFMEQELAELRLAFNNGLF